MKEPKVATEVVKKKAVKKTARSVTAKSKPTSAVSVSLKKRVPPQKSSPNFTLAELSESVAAKSSVRKRAKTSSVAEPAQVIVREVQTVATEVATNSRVVLFTQVLGMGLAVFGLCFAVAFGSGFLPPRTQPAQSVGAVGTSSVSDFVATTTESIHCSNGLILVSSTCVNPKPSVKFNVPGDHTKLHGTVPVQVTVENATRVKLSMYSKDAATSFDVGVMNKVSDKDYSFDWPTDNFHDGAYYPLATIDNQYGSYDTGDTAQMLTVVNNPPITTATTTVSGTSSSSSLPPPPPPPPALTSNLSNSASQVNFSLKVSNVLSAVLYAKLLPDGASSPIGTAYRYSDTEWRYIWQLATVPPGNYSVVAQVQRSSTSTVQSTAVTITRSATSATSTLNATATLAAVAPTTTASLTPTVNALLPTMPLHGIAQFTIQVPDATGVLVYMQSSNSLVKTSLGTASQADANAWVVSFDTAKVPNGDYKLIVAVTNTYGTYDTQLQTFSIKNQVAVTPTPEETAKVTQLEGAASALSPSVTPPPPKKTTTNSAPVVSSSTLVTVLEAVDSAIQPELTKLATVLRLGDSLAVSTSKANIDALAKQAMYQMIGSSGSDDVIQKVHKHVVDAIAQVESNVVTIDKIITDRTGDNASKDSDSDGIPDFDEVTIYHTNPFAADTDNDGFLDGAEIMSGHDPLSAKTEALLAYESPKVSGVEQKNLLVVNSVTTATPVIVATSTEEKKQPIAIISGKAPANSFVTLYIFSTPIIVTIKTDSDGGWNYHFDKELENGTHEVYVGVTDNAGKVVAKSAPFTFVKTAEAYSGQKEVTDAVAAPVQPVEHNLLSSTMLYILSGVTISLIGLLLAFMGTRFGSRRRIVENIIA
jgi:hypothetical protein